MELSIKDWLIIFMLFAPLVLGLFTNCNLLKDKVVQALLLFLTGSLLLVYPRFSFFHFQTALALVVILYGYLLSKIKITELHTVSITSYLLLSTFLIQQPILTVDFKKEARFYGEDEKQLAQIISRQVPKDEKVYLLGLPSNLYVMAHRVPPKRWTDNFSWYLEIPGVQEEVISRWNTNPPKYVFWKTPSSGSEFDLGTYQPKKIVGWIEVNYLKKEEIKPGIWLWEKK